MIFPLFNMFFPCKSAEIEYGQDRVPLGGYEALSLGGGRFPSLQLAADIIHPSQHIIVFGVVISADLGLEKHAIQTSARLASTIFINFDTSGVH